MNKNTHPMAELLNDLGSMPVPPKPGETVTGVVVNIDHGRILVEMAGAYTGIIAGREAVDGLDTAKNLAVGDEVTAFVVEDEVAEGHYVLSLRKAGREKAWDRLKKLQGNGEVIEVRIKEANKGGLMTEYAGIRAFIPVSQLTPEHYPRVNDSNSAEILSRLQKYIGEKFVVTVINVDRNEGKLILSEKASMGGKRSAAIGDLQVGQKVKGRVSGIVNFGIFLIFNECLEGLVHLSELAWEKISDPAAVAKIGEEKEAVVIGVDNEKISLSIKRLLPDPWCDLVKDYAVGDLVKGTVNKITPFGAFVTIKKDLNGLIHISEFETAEGTEPAVDLVVDQEVEAKIINIDTEEHRLGLSLKDLESKPKKSTKKKEEAVEEEKEAEEKPAKKTTKKAKAE